MKVLLFIPLFFFLSWQNQSGDQISIDVIKADKSFIHYMELMNAHQKAIIRDEWGLRTEKVKNELEDAKRKKNIIDFYKKLKNAKGISYHAATNELMSYYIRLSIKYSLKVEVNKKVFNEAMKQYSSEHKPYFTN
jgi:hypothetical protein